MGSPSFVWRTSIVFLVLSLLLEPQVAAQKSKYFYGFKIIKMGQK